MPEVPERLLCLVAQHFNSKEKARLWFEISNPELCWFRPKDCHINGNWDALEKKIKNAMKGAANEKQF